MSLLHVMRGHAVTRVSWVVARGLATTTPTNASATTPGGKTLVLIDGVRTPFLQAHTDFKHMMPHDLQRAAILGLVNRLRLDRNIVDYVCCGSVIQEVKTANVAREAALGAGFSDRIPAHTVSMACISSNQVRMRPTRTFKSA